MQLGKWVGNQRRAKKNGTLAADREKRLNRLDFVWDGREARWEAGYAALKGFRTRERHARVPAGHQEGGVQLGKWVGNQRRAKKNGTLAADREKRLNRLDFVWDARIAQSWGAASTPVREERDVRRKAL